MKLVLLDHDDSDIDEFDLTESYDSLKSEKKQKQLIKDILEALATYPEDEEKKAPRKKKSKKPPQESPVIH